MSAGENERDEDRQKVIELVKAAKIAQLTTVEADGSLVSRPLVVQDVEFDGDLWFFTQDPSAKTVEIEANPQVNVSMQSGSGMLSISGTAAVVNDPARVKKYWSPTVEAWFPQGKDDPSVALIKVSAETAEYWAMDEPKLVALFKLAKSAVGGGQPDLGTNRTVQL